MPHYTQSALIAQARRSTGARYGVAPPLDRTFALVSLGAAVFTAYALAAMPANADKVVAGVVTGASRS